MLNSIFITSFAELFGSLNYVHVYVIKIFFNILSIETKKLENEFPSPILTEKKKDLTRKSSTNSRLC